jgi:hypothetical protein
MMKQAVALFIFCILCWKGEAQSVHDLAIPAVVAVDKASSTTRCPGTNTFIHQPVGYTLNKQLIRFQKNEGTYIQLIQLPLVSNFEVKRKEMDDYFQRAIATGKLEKEYYKKEFNLGDCNALLYYGNDDKKEGFEQMVLLFGDNTFVNMVVGEFPADQPLVRKEILDGLLSMYVDKAVPIDPTELANFTIKTDNTAFKFFGSASQMFYYTIGGKGDPMQDPYESQIMVQALPAMQEEELRSYALKMIYNYRLLGMRIPTYSGKDTTINGQYAYQITFEGSFNGKKNDAYQFVTGNQHGSVLFLGGLYDRPEDLMPQVRAIVATLRLK